MQCFVEMQSAEDAEKMGEHCKEQPLKYNGKRLTIYVSRKYRQLKHGSAPSLTVVSSSCEKQIVKFSVPPPSGIDVPLWAEGTAGAVPPSLLSLLPRSLGGRSRR